MTFGVGLGVANAVGSLVLWRLGRRRRDRAFYTLVLGGMVVRMALLLAAMGLVLWLVPLDVIAFIGALFATFVLGLAVEIAQIARRPAQPADPTP